MTNYCSNTLIVRGEDVHLFLEACKGTTPGYVDAKEPPKQRGFTFNGILPVPVTVEKVGINKVSTVPYLEGEDLLAYRNRTKDIIDGYQWQMIHWGTRSDASFVCIREVEDATIILFETAWTPPLAWLKKAIDLFPRLDFELSYVEDNEGMAGEFCCKKGVLQDVCYDRCKDEIQYESFVSAL